MSITIADRTLIRPATGLSSPDNGHVIPAVAKVAMTNPGPVSVDSTSPSAGGQAKVIQSLGPNGRAGYLGYNVSPSRTAGQGCAVLRNVLVDGFAGVTPGQPVYVDDAGADASGTASGLTHTAPSSGATSNSFASLTPATISATTSFNVLAPAAGSLSAVELAVKTAIAGDDTNYWTVSIVNKGQAGTGTAPMLAATDVNTTKATGGTPLPAYTPTALTINGTAGNLVVAANDVLEVTFTKTASAGNLVEPAMNLVFSTSVPARRIGVGVGSTSIYFE